MKNQEQAEIERYDRALAMFGDAVKIWTTPNLTVADFE